MDNVQHVVNIPIGNGYLIELAYKEQRASICMIDVHDYTCFTGELSLSQIDNLINKLDILKSMLERKYEQEQV